MTARILYIIFGALFYLMATPAGMAKVTVPEEVRADFLIDGQKQDFQEAVLYLFDEATMAEGDSSTEFESETESESDSKRLKKRSAGKKFFINGFCTVVGLSADVRSKEESRSPLTQDAQQERRAVIRFLQLSAAIC